MTRVTITQNLQLEVCSCLRSPQSTLDSPFGKKKCVEEEEVGRRSDSEQSVLEVSPVGWSGPGHL